MSDNNKRSETTDSFRRVLQYTDIVCSVLILLVAFLLNILDTYLTENSLKKLDFSI